MKGVNNTIEALNKYIVNKREEESIDSRALLYLHQERFPSSTFTKAIKTYRYSLWYIDGAKKRMLFSFEQSYRSVTDTEKEEAIDQMNIELLVRTIDLIRGPEFSSILTGKFEEDDTNK